MGSAWTRGALGAAALRFSKPPRQSSPSQVQLMHLVTRRREFRANEVIKGKGQGAKIENAESGKSMYAQRMLDGPRPDLLDEQPLSFHALKYP